MAFDAVGELAAQPGGQELSALVARVQQVDPEVLHGDGPPARVDGRGRRRVAAHGAPPRRRRAGRLAGAGRRGPHRLPRRLRPRGHADARRGRPDPCADRRRRPGARRAARARSTRQVSRALDAARRARSEALADPARAPMADQLAAQAMAEPTAAARTAVERAETALGDTARALREMTADVVGFSRLPAPDARPIAPTAGGGPLGWSATPAAESLATVPASVDGDGGAQGIDLDGGGASSDVSSVSDSSSADDASGVSAGSRPSARNPRRRGRRLGSGNAGDSADPGEGRAQVVGMLRFPKHPGRRSRVPGCGDSVIWGTTPGGAPDSRRRTRVVGMLRFPKRLVRTSRVRGVWVTRVIWGTTSWGGSGFRGVGLGWWGCFGFRSVRCGASRVPVV